MVGERAGVGRFSWISSCLLLGSSWPGQTNLTPALFGKRAHEEDMFHGFLWRVLAEHASVVAPGYSKVPPLQHVPGVQTIDHKQPPKHLELDRAFGFQ